MDDLTLLYTLNLTLTLIALITLGYKVACDHQKRHATPIVVVHGRLNLLVTVNLTYCNHTRTIKLIIYAQFNPNFNSSNNPRL